MHSSVAAIYKFNLVGSASPTALITNVNSYGIGIYSQKTLSSIAITTSASKLSYTVGESLSVAGMVVTGTYSDTTTAVLPVTTANVTGFDSSAAVASQTLTVTVNGQTTTYTVAITAASAATLDSIAITTSASKLSYTVGESLSVAGW